jgi:hypothetical protein
MALLYLARLATGFGRSVEFYRVSEMGKGAVTDRVKNPYPFEGKRDQTPDSTRYFACHIGPYALCRGARDTVNLQAVAALCEASVAPNRVLSVHYVGDRGVPIAHEAGGESRPLPF